MKDETHTVRDSENQSPFGDISGGIKQLEEDPHIQLSKERFLLVLIGLVLAIFPVIRSSPLC